VHHDYNGNAFLGPARIHGRGIVGGAPDHRPDYATQLPGAPSLPGSTGALPTERVRIRDLAGLVFENWLPFTWQLIQRVIAPRPPTYPWESPFDLDAGERITRFGTFPSSERPFPYPWMVGAVAGNCPLLDQYSLAWAWGKTPSGPGVLTPIPVPWDTTYPTLTKVTG